MKYKIALIDDDAEASESLMRALVAHGVIPPGRDAEWSLVTRVEHVEEKIIPLQPHVVVLDLCLESSRGVESGFEVLSRLTRNLETTRVIVLTGHGEAANGLRALNAGAASFLQKPADIPLLVALIRDGIAQAELRSTVVNLQREKSEGLLSTYVGTSKAAEELRRQLQFASAVSQPVLLTGETGTGKGFFARLIHRCSKRAGAPFVRCQPQFGSADLTMSELFGHEKGAFTGASERREGLLSASDGGTLFIDEVDQYPLETQVALLEVLQERVYRPIGSDRERASNFRLLCAMNRDPLEAVESKELRKDFYHRISHLRIHLPALRERKEDIPLFAKQTLQRLCELEELSVSDFTPQALSVLREYYWPGNIRELHAVVEGAAYRAQFAGRYAISGEDIVFAGADAPVAAGEDRSFHSQVEQFKRTLIHEALQRHDGNKARAALELGLDRGTLRRLLSP